MARSIKYPVGIQTFSEIITDNYLYVDKTALVYKLVDNNKYVFLSRPRRFGKSLLMSTLEAYFRGQRELFEGLAISKLETDWETYPVFRFDLSGENFDHPQRLIDHIASLLDDIEEDYGLESEGSVSRRFRKLIRDAYRKFGKRVVILIDEYDKPMLDCLHDDDVHGKIKAELRGFYSVLKPSDAYIKFAMLTGVTKFGKVSVFSGLNNLKDISMWTEFNALCGISESELRSDFVPSVKEFAARNGCTEEEVWQEFKGFYDGYRFEYGGEYIYNPFSVLSAFDSGKLRGYWFTTGSSSYLVKLVRRYHFILSYLEGERRKASALSDISDISRDLVPLLYQAGYLTIKDYNETTKEYTLGFPNREVYEGFWDSLASYFFQGYGGRSTFDLQAFLSDVNEGRPEKFMERLKSLFADTESSHEPNKEIHFQNMMAMACKMMGLAVRTEIHSSLGRCDMQIETP
ncbi:MAG: AAA family ATPase, partial [Muribaculaceae bacterium]|nr:AAA family ATPase [Muribaculaceae bacterium]